ncbi:MULTISPECIES: SDR family NAD(P)-dependent oxidoreductase [Paenibacillus]|uniref:SDR family NAD(P)-dependent oxidoreductase n=1 Tax=Paenibacillus TaxID=44249 RepID=UPI0009B8D660|nr:MULTISPECIES: SDR family oxidoreductase [Paenibacillus]UOD87099.1 NAD(P)-dependent oxidoreductase [Paenibacillus polymyxa ATCC 842]MBE3648713.1 SDR family oxidoreductase [Paenibacillus polymyxa]MBY0072131.1 SDR family oxidoreductase [Paenibacillus polymyxa]MBY7737501.1 SDR family oxidoreductase [Paenibacillus polymyxa]MBZ6445806.1 SDR family oxidoreductase [Paenibacillus polymyxa]
MVNVSSIVGLKAFLAYGAYVASKHAIQSLTNATALDYASQGIRINTVAPRQPNRAVEYQGVLAVMLYLYQLKPAGDFKSCKRYCLASL